MYLHLLYRNPPLFGMMKDKFANYVIQKAVELSPVPIRDVLIAKIREVPDPNNYCIYDI